MSDLIQRLPSCCGSEDGDLVYGFDGCKDMDVMCAVWVCNTCGVLSVVSMTYLDR